MLLRVVHLNGAPNAKKSGSARCESPLVLQHLGRRSLGLDHQPRAPVQQQPIRWSAPNPTSAVCLHGIFARKADAWVSNVALQYWAPPESAVVLAFQCLTLANFHPLRQCSQPRSSLLRLAVCHLRIGAAAETQSPDARSLQTGCGAIR